MRQALHNDYSHTKASAYLAEHLGKEVWIKSIFTHKPDAEPFLRDPGAWLVEIVDLSGKISIVSGNTLRCLDHQPGLWPDIDLLQRVKDGWMTQEAYNAVNSLDGRDSYRVSED